MENTVNVEVLRVKAVDLDVMYTDYWLAVFSIESGNEAGYFTITTDSKTNEGVIMIRKVWTPPLHHMFHCFTAYLALSAFF